jgi:hypothetical protein
VVVMRKSISEPNSLSSIRVDDHVGWSFSLFLHFTNGAFSSRGKIAAWATENAKSKMNKEAPNFNGRPSAYTSTNTYTSNPFMGLSASSGPQL